MKNIILPAKILAAARLFCAKKDIRYYLHGIYISNDEIVATNGHALFHNKYSDKFDVEKIKDLVILRKELAPAKRGRPPKMASIFEDKFKYIIKLMSAPPSGAYYALLNRIDPDSAYVEYFFEDGKSAGAGIVKIIDADYVNYQHVIGRDQTPSGSTSICINPTYLEACTKAAKIITGRYWSAIKFAICAPDNRLIGSIPGTIHKERYGDINFVVLPMRE